MKKASFAIALHLHQPIGNFEHIMERAYRDCYSPLIDTFLEYPDIKLAFHISGCLLDYFEARYPQLLEKVKDMVASGQVELLSGGYYEPILISIPRRDILGQIEMMFDYINARFNYRPKGMWIPERVWKPSLTEPLTEARIDYCILDDTHLIKAGIKKERMYGYFLTGVKESRLAVFPSDKRLRYIVPFGNPSEVIDYFNEVTNREKDPLFVYGDDGEKFGEWPGTHKWVYEERWLRSFLDEIIKNRDWLKTVHFSDTLRLRKPLGEIDIPEASYDEMIEWIGESWLNFLKKYPEANHMHKKMHYVSQKLEDALRVQKNDKDLKEARRELYKGQCNCAYWHGVFGGLYLYHLRSAVYSHLIKADTIIDGVMHKKAKGYLEVKEDDFDSDGKKEVIMESPSFALYLDPEEGGVLKELDYRPLSLNLINTLSRHREGYHQKILNLIKREKKLGDVQTIHEDIRTIDPSLKRRLIYDRYPRYCLRDYFVSGKTERTLGPYKAKIIKDRVMLQHTGRIASGEVTVIKEISIKSDKELGITYSIEKKTLKQLDTSLGIEFNITMPYLDSERYKYVSNGKVLGGLDEEGRVEGASMFGIVDSEREFSVELEFSDRAKEIIYLPVKTVSQSERAYELNFQCSSLTPIWRLYFKKGRFYSLNISVIFKTSKDPTI